MTKRTTGLLIVLAIVITIAAVMVTMRVMDSSIKFTATAGDEFELYIKNYSDTTLIVNHITVITSRGVLITQENIRITNGSLYVKAPIEWHPDEDAVVLVGCTYGKVNFVKQVTNFL